MYLNGIYFGPRALKWGLSFRQGIYCLGTGALKKPWGHLTIRRAARQDGNCDDKGKEGRKPHEIRSSINSRGLV